MISACGYNLASARGDLLRLVETGQHLALLLVGQEDVDAEVLRDGEEVIDTHLVDHLERAGVERQCRTRLLGKMRSGTRAAVRGGSTKNDHAVRCRCRARAITVARQLDGKQVEVGAVARHHRALAGVVDEHGDGSGEVRVGLDEVGDDVLATRSSWAS